MKTSTSLFILLPLLPLVLSASAFAQCRQANFQSADGSRIAIHYSSNNQSDGDTAWVSPTIHVTLSADQCSAQGVVVELIQSQFGNTKATSLTLSKDQAPCEFSASAGTVLYANHGGAPDQQIAVRVISPRGTSDWLVDPISGGHNFNYSFQISGYSPDREICE